MAYWIIPTTADIGLRVFGPTPESVLVDAVEGLSAIVSPSWSNDLLSSLPGDTRWVKLTPSSTTWEDLLVALLEEILFIEEVNSEWITRLLDWNQQVGNVPPVEFKLESVHSEHVTREIEVKAVTRHELKFRQLLSGDLLPPREGAEALTGPGWFAEVVLDI